MAGFIVIVVASFIFAISAAQNNGHACPAASLTLKSGDITDKWITMNDLCTNLMREQVKRELNAAMTYLAMGAHFSKDTVNRPGIAKMFFESASEEREHAIKIMSYLLMRGGLTHQLKSLIENPQPKDDKLEWKDAVEAITDALDLEASVTENIVDIIKGCESGDSKKGNKKNGHGKSQLSNDYHLVDYLSGDFLDEQYKGQRDLAGKLSILYKMKDINGQLGEFLFDKKLLKGEIAPLG